MNRTTASPSSGNASQPLALYKRLGFLLRRAHQLSVGIFEEECRSLSLTPPQWGVLTIVQSVPGTDQTSLARALGFDKVTTMRLVRSLEERGLLQRAQSMLDKRQHELALTEAGHRMLTEAALPVELAHKRLLSPLTEAEQAQLIHLLGKLGSKLTPGARVIYEPLHLQKARKRG